MCVTTPPPPPPYSGDLGLQVIPSFRDAAASALGERWASVPQRWYAPGGEKNIPLPENAGDEDGSSRNSNMYSRASPTSAMSPTRWTENADHLASPPCSAAVSAAGAGGDGISRDRRDGADVAPASEHPRVVGSVNGVASSENVGGASEHEKDDEQSRWLREEGSNDAVIRPVTTERNNAKDLAEYLGVRGASRTSVRVRERGRGRGAGGGFAIEGFPEQEGEVADDADAAVSYKVQYHARPQHIARGNRTRAQERARVRANVSSIVNSEVLQSKNGDKSKQSIEVVVAFVVHRVCACRGC